MNKKGISIIVLAILIGGTILYMIFNPENIESRIVAGKFYQSSTVKTSEVISFTINPQNYNDYNSEEMGKRTLLVEKYDTKVYLEPIKNNGDSLWIELSFVNNWWKMSGECLTFRDIEVKDGTRLYSDINPTLQVVDQNEMKIYDEWGGGGSTYAYGFSVKKQVFQNCKSINIKLSNFNVLRYSLSLFIL